MRSTVTRAAAAVALALACTPVVVSAAPYASGITFSGNTVNFILNEPADSLTVSINGGLPVALDGTSKGLKSFNVASPTDTFSIVAKKNDTVGYTIPTGATINPPAAANGLVAPAPEAGFRLISDDSSTLNKFNSPRGLSISNNPNASNFGTTYVSNSAAGTTGGRSVGDGIYALRADGSDFTGNGNTAANPGGIFVASASTPWRNFVGSDGQLYVADFTDSNGNVYALNPTLTTGTAMLNGIGGPSTVPNTQKHGSATAVYVEGSLAAGNLKLYTIDEDLTELTGTGAGNNTTKLNLWRYDIGSGPYPYAGTPTKINGAGTLLINGTDELIRGADGKYYLSQLRSAGTDAPSILVLDATGAVVFNSLTVSGGSQDIIRNVQGMAVSDDQKWMALMLNDSDVAVVPLVNGIPDLAGRMIVNTAPDDVISGRDIAFDAAGNIHYVSSGQGLYRVLSPGGFTEATTSFDGSNFAFAIAVPEPTTLSALALGAAGLLARRRPR